jgi:hypothetical protein
MAFNDGLCTRMICVGPAITGQCVQTKDCKKGIKIVRFGVVGKRASGL